MRQIKNQDGVDIFIVENLEMEKAQAIAEVKDSETAAMMAKYPVADIVVTMMGLMGQDALDAMKADFAKSLETVATKTAAITGCTTDEEWIAHNTGA